MNRATRVGRRGAVLAAAVFVVLVSMSACAQDSTPREQAVPQPSDDGTYQTLGPAQLPFTAETMVDTIQSRFPEYADDEVMRAIDEARSNLGMTDSEPLDSQSFSAVLDETITVLTGYDVVQ